jgi:hypothetical protein
MKEFAASTMWRISAFERAREGAGDSTVNGAAGTSVMPTTLFSTLRRLQADPHDNDLLSFVAACVRKRMPARLYIEHGPWLWTVSLFPEQQVYHSAQDIAAVSSLAALSKARLMNADTPTLRPPALHRMAEGGAAEKFLPINTLLGALALYGPRNTLLADIGGRAAYRLAPSGAESLPEAAGALAPAIQRLRRQAAPLRDISRWPGMSTERACRLLNAMYLTGGLMVTRAHPSARQEPGSWRGLLGRKE